MRADGRTHSPDEPAREKAYRRLYRCILALEHQSNDTLDFILQKFERLEKRVAELERKLGQ